MGVGEKEVEEEFNTLIWMKILVLRLSI